MSETFATLLERMMADLPNPFGPPLPLHEEALEVIEDALALRTEAGTSWETAEGPRPYRATIVGFEDSLDALHLLLERVSAELSQRYGEPTVGSDGSFRTAWWQQGDGAFALWEDAVGKRSHVKRLRFAQWERGEPETMPPRGIRE